LQASGSEDGNAARGNRDVRVTNRKTGEQNLRLVRWFALAIVVSAALVGAFIALFSKPPPAPQPALYGRALLPAVARPQTLRLAPSGLAFAYVAALSDANQQAETETTEAADSSVFIQPLAQTPQGPQVPERQPAVKLEGASGASAVIWSAHSRSLAVGLANELAQFSVEGVREKSLCALEDLLLDGDWNSNGDVVFATHPGRLYVLKQGSGTPAPLFPDAVDRVAPRFMPDGRILFREIRGADEALMLLEPEPQKVRNVADNVTAYDFDPSGQAVYTRGVELFTQRLDLPTANIVGRPFRFSWQAAGTRLSAPYASLSHEGTLAIVSQPTEASARTARESESQSESDTDAGVPAPAAPVQVLLVRPWSSAFIWDNR